MSHNTPEFSMAQAMAPRLSSSFRLIDFFRLGGAMPEEVVRHMSSLWTGMVFGTFFFGLNIEN
jgi:hypothetical protein